MQSTKRRSRLLLALGLASALILLTAGLIVVSLAAPADPGELRPAISDAPVVSRPASPLGTSTIGDYVWYDVNANGVFDGGEAQYLAGINNVWVNLYVLNPISGTFNLISTTVTGADPNTPGSSGWYSFGVTAEGNVYRVEIAPSNFITGPLQGMVVTTGSNLQTRTLSGLVNDDFSIDFGFVSTGIVIAKTPDLQYVSPNSTVTFTIAVTNTGDAPLSGVAVTDALAPGCDNTIGNLAPHTSTSYTCTVTAGSSGFTNVALVTGDPSDDLYTPLQNVGPVTAQDSANVVVAGPGLTIDKKPPLQYVALGGTATFTITVTNTGDVTMTNVTVSDPQAPGCVRNVGTLNPGQSTSYQCTVANVLNSFVNVASVTGTPPPGVTPPPPANSPPAQVIVAQPAIDIAKTPDLQYTDPGALVTFTIDDHQHRQRDPDQRHRHRPAGAQLRTATSAPLAPGATTGYTCTVVANASFTNVASVTGTPTDHNGVPIPGATPPTDQDSAVVVVARPGPDRRQAAALAVRGPRRHRHLHHHRHQHRRRHPDQRHGGRSAGARLRAQRRHAEPRRSPPATSVRWPTC